MSQELVDALRAACAESQGDGAESITISHSDSDYPKTGFHHEWRCVPTEIVPLATVFRTHEYFLEFITAQDRRAESGGFRVVYCFNRLDTPDRHIVRIDVADEQPLPTLNGAYGAARWMERETWEMYGVVFTDHPNLKRLLLPEDADFFALRKDFGRIEDAPAAAKKGD